MGPIIDLTHLFPWRIINLFCCSVSHFCLFKALLKDKYHPIITFLAIFSARILTSVLFYNNEALNLFGYPTFAGLCLIIVLITTTNKIYDKLLTVVVSIILQFSCGMIGGSIKMLVFQGKTYDEVYGSSNQNLDHIALFLGDCIIILALSAFLTALLKLYKRKRSNVKTSKLLIYMSAFPVTHITFIILPLMLVPIELDKNYLGYKTYLIVFILFTIIMFIDCAFPIVINHFEKIQEKNIETERELLKNTMDYHQMLMMKQEKQEFRKIKHDFANIITTAKGFIEINKPEKALNILSNTNEDLIGLAGFSVCSNETINTVLYIKKQQAEKNNIDLNIEIEENAALLIDDYDLCRLLHNLIDNTLNAVLQPDVDKCCKISIEINDEKLTIKTENKYKSIKTKRSKKSDEHGNGTGIIKSIISKYSGKYICNQLNDVWNTETFLNNKKPVNSTPPPNFGLIPEV